MTLYVSCKSLSNEIKVILSHTFIRNVFAQFTVFFSQKKKIEKNKFDDVAFDLYCDFNAIILIDKNQTPK